MVYGHLCAAAVVICWLRFSCCALLSNVHVMTANRAVIGLQSLKGFSPHSIGDRMSLQKWSISYQSKTNFTEYNSLE